MEIQDEIMPTNNLPVTAGETAATSVSAQMVAAVQARYVLAMKSPRDWMDVRARLLKECQRPSFAAVARYRKPIGKGVEGPSIRFAEAALRAMGNVYCDTKTIYDDPAKRIVRVSVMDLEANLSFERDVTIEKTVERSAIPKGESPISMRYNSYGKPVYTVRATDDDMLSKEASLVSKALRTWGLRLLPGDLLDECMRAVVKTANDETAKDPDAARKAVADGFASVNVQPSMVAEYLGHAIDTCTPAEIDDLRALYVTLRDGETTWVEVMANKGDAAAESAPTPDPVTQKVRDRLAKSKQAEPGEAAA